MIYALIKDWLLMALFQCISARDISHWLHIKVLRVCSRYIGIGNSWWSTCGSGLLWWGLWVGLWRFLEYDFFLWDLFLESKKQLQQYFHLLIENSLEPGYEVSTSLQMGCWNTIDIYIVNALISAKHLSVELSFQQIGFKSFETLFQVGWKNIWFHCVKHYIEFCWLSDKIILGDLFQEVVVH